MPLIALLIALALANSFGNSFAIAQTERYELGKRLHRFEVAWQTASAESRTASTKPMQNAVESFFSFQLVKAARALDDAYFSVSVADQPSPLQRYILAHRCITKPLVVDASQPTCDLKLELFYPPVPNKEVQFQETPFRIALIDQHDKFRNALPETQEATLKELQKGVSLKLDHLSEGDYTLELTALGTTESISLPTMRLSVISNLKSRLEKLSEWVNNSTPDSRESDQLETVRLTVRQFRTLIQSQAEGRQLEIDYPAATLLRLAEALIDAPSDAASLFSEVAAETVWMTLSYQRQNVAVRVHVPNSNSVPRTTVTSAPKPVLFAFHGAGGSENMFFETYGAGRLVELASERGWIVVAPRRPLLGMPLNYRQMLESLAHFFPVDKERVFLVGHSMGASEVVQQTSLSEKAPQAVVAIGGGGNAKDVASIKKAPWMVIAGELDFGRGGAKALTKRLAELGCDHRYLEIAGVEHLVIVQAALDDTFAFLDQQLPN